MVTNQNQLSNGRPVYTGNQSIWTVYNLHHFTCGLLLFFFYWQKWTQASPVSLRGPTVEAGNLMQVREAETQLESNLLQVSLRREAVLILALASSPYQQILPFFPDMLAQDLTGENWGGRRRRRRGGRERREGGHSPRAGGRYCMHVHSSTRFVASCLRIFLGSQDYPQSQ